jgi:hypothetical protein
MKRSSSDSRRLGVATLLALPSASHGDAMSVFNAALITSIAGILVSGVVGPQFTSWSTRRANSKQFNRDQNARRRNDLRALLDEAALLLASGATNLRHLREANPDPELANWLSQIFPLGQRLRLRLPKDHQIVRAYAEVTDALATAADSNIQAVVADFETKRDRFLDVARQTLNTEIPEDGDAE